MSEGVDRRAAARLRARLGALRGAVVDDDGIHHLVVEALVIVVPEAPEGIDQADPAEEAADGDFGLLGPGVDEIDELIAGIVRNPAVG